jgi:type VI secretion system secreted protein Hcp
MALSIFLKIDEIDSKPNSAGHVSQIDVRSWRWGASTSALGTPAVQDLCVTKYIDRASPKLLAACFGATHIDNALLSAYDGSEASPVEYVKIKIQNAFISSIAAGGPDSDGRLTEEITLNFSKVNVDYTLRGSNGAQGTAVSFGWDIAANAMA